MEPRRTAHIVGANIAAAMTATGHSPESVAKATGLNPTELSERLDGVAPFTIRQLVQVGGLFALPPTSFLQGATA